ncbi:hypothetical protein D5086_027208 [Populus alba]|uniref:Uncharacterized protein n=1 Tax=Populus alba TaxID=43335 RepID=A0ACC4B4J9_POPAL
MLETQRSRKTTTKTPIRALGKTRGVVTVSAQPRRNQEHHHGLDPRLRFYGAFLACVCALSWTFHVLSRYAYGIAGWAGLMLFCSSTGGSF